MADVEPGQFAVGDQIDPGQFDTLRHALPRLLPDFDHAAEALERLDELLAAEVVDPYVYELLRELPPDIAEERLRAGRRRRARGERKRRWAKVAVWNNTLSIGQEISHS